MIHFPWRMALWSLVAVAAASAAAPQGMAAAFGRGGEPGEVRTAAGGEATGRTGSLVEQLLAGRDTSAYVASLRDIGTGKTRQALHAGRTPGALQHYAQAADALLAAIEHAKAGARDPGVADAGERLQAAILLARAEFDRLHALAARTPQAPGAAGRIDAARRQWARHADVLDAALSSLRENPADAPSLARAVQALHALAGHSAPPPILGANPLPVHRPRLLPRLPSDGPEVVPAYATGTLVEPLPEDFAGGADAVLSAAVREKAAQLGNNYVAIADFVRSQVRTEWRAGSAQAVDDTLRRMAGNDIEQASLLIALLRASAAPARYVNGVVEVAVAELAAQVGVPQVQLGAALAAAGIAHEPVLAGGQVVAFRIEHTWVAARVPYANYRGSVADTGAPTWVPLMPALKPALFEPGTPALAGVDLDVSDWIAAHLQGPTDPPLPWTAFRNELTAALAAASPPLSLDAIAALHKPDATPLQVLPASTPHRVLRVTSESAELLPEQRQWLRVRVLGGAGGGEPLMDQRLALSELGSGRLLLTWLPATVEDQHLANRRGGPGGFPWWMLQLRPALLLDGRPLAPGQGTTLAGHPQRLELEFSAPGGAMVLEQQLTAGALAAIVVDAVAGLADPADATPAESIQAAGVEPPAGRILTGFGVRYLREWAAADAASASALGVRLLRPLPSLVLVLPQYRAEGAGGLVEDLVFEGVALDAAAHPVEPLSLRSHPADEADWLRLSSLHGSALEASLFEALWGVQSLSADRALRRAADRGNPVLTLQPGDGTGALALHMPAVRNAVAAWLGRGYEVSIPRDPLQEQAWAGAAWRVHAPDSGESGYFLSGGWAGGVTVIPPGLWAFADLAAILADPFAPLPNDNPLAGHLVQLDAEAQNQFAAAGDWLERPLSVWVTDRHGSPVQGAQVLFTLAAGGALLQSGDEQGASVIALTDNRGVASVQMRAPETGHGLGGGFVLLPGDVHHRRVHASSVEVQVATAAGPLMPGEPYRSFMYAAAAVAIEVEPRQSGSSVVPPGLAFVGYTARAFDAYGNLVANQPLNISVSDQYEGPSCPADFNLPRSGIFLPGDCSVPLGPDSHLCGVASIAAATTHDGVWFNVVPSSLYSTRTTVTVESVELGTHTATFRTSAAPRPNGGGECDVEGALWSLQATLGSEQEIAALDQPLPQPRRFALYATTGGQNIVGASWSPASVQSASLTLDGGSASPVRHIGQGVFEFEVRAGPAPGRIQGTMHATATVGGQPRSVSQPFAPGWALDISPPFVNPARLELDPFQRSTETLRLGAAIRPEAYRAHDLLLKVHGYDGVTVGFCALVGGGDGSVCDIARGSLFPAGQPYYAGYVLNASAGSPVASPTTQLFFGRGIVVGYGAIEDGIEPPDLDRFLDSRFPKRLQATTELDSQTSYTCSGSDQLAYALGQEAEVSITFYDLDEDGERGLPAWHAVPEQLHQAGVHRLDIDAQSLPFGEYELELVATAGDETETHQGSFSNRLIDRGALPLSHSFVKGVDVYDGHAVVSVEDAAVGGRGPGMRFSRTWSSSVGEEQTLLGRGWSSDLESKVVHDSCGSYIVTGSAGQGQRYVPDGTYPDGSPRFRSPNGFHGTLRVLEGGGYDFFAKDGTRYHFAEEVAGATFLSFIEDTNGNRVSYQYQTLGLERVPARLVDSAGRSLQFEYDMLTFTRRYGPFEVQEVRNVMVALNGPGGLRVDYGYDDDGNLASVRRFTEGQSGEKREEYVYTDFGGMLVANPDGDAKFHWLGFRMTEARDPVADATRYYEWRQEWLGFRDEDLSIRYTPQLRVATLTEPDQGATRFTYVGLRGVEQASTDVEDARHYTTRYTMNAAGAAEGVETPGGTTTTAWNTIHLQPDSVTDALGTVTSYEYDEHGNRELERIVHPTGRSVERRWVYVAPAAFALPIKNRVRTEIDGRQIATEFAYDPRGNQTGRERGGVQETWTYLPNGDRSSWRDGLGRIVHYAYDGWGNLVSETDQLGLRSGAEWDERGRKLVAIDGNGHRTRTWYDALDRPVRIVFPQAPVEGVGAVETERRIIHDDAARTRTEIDENEHATTYHHDTMGRLVQVVNADNQSRVLDYDRNGNKILETDFRRNATTYEYNGDNHLILRIDPEGRVTEYTPDALGHVLQETVRRTDGSEARTARYAYEHPLYLRTSAERELVEESRWVGTYTEYDENGNRVQEKDARGFETSFVHDPRDRLIAILSPEGREQHFTYDEADNRIGESLNTEPPQVRSWEHDQRGREHRHTDATGGLWRTSYDLAGNVTSRTDPRGSVITLTWDARNRQLGESGPEPGMVSSFGYDAAGNRVRESTPDGRVLTHHYDDLNRRILSHDQLGTVEHLEYDADGNVLVRRDGLGRRSESDFDGLNRETERRLPPVDGVPRTLAFTHTIHGEVGTETDPRSATTTHTYDSLGRRVSTQLPGVDEAPDGYIRTFAYDDAGNLVSSTDTNAYTTTFDFDGLNRRTRETSPAPLGYVQTWTYDSAGNILTHSDRRGIASSWTYDGENRQTTWTRDGQLRETRSYDAAGNLATVTDALGRETVNQYDRANRRTREQRPMGAVQAWEYWPWGGARSHADADGLLTQFTYDIRQRLLTETNAANETTIYGYDAVGNRTSVQRPLGEAWTWTFGYDAADRLASVLSPEDHLTTYRYDANGNHTLTEDAEGQVTTTAYDALNRVDHIDHPGVAEESFAHDGEANQLQRTDPNGQVITTAWDPLNRPASRSYSAATGPAIRTIAWQYDGNGNIERITQTAADGGSHLTRRVWDTQERPDTETDRFGLPTDSDYDAQGNRIRRTDPAGTTLFTPDLLDRMATVEPLGNGATVLSYTSAGRPAVITHPNGARSEHSYDPAGRLQAIHHYQGDLLVRSFSYAYDANGNRTSEADTGPDGTRSLTYTYDRDDRLTGITETTPDGTVTQTAYTLDGAGNRLTETVTVDGVPTADKTYGYGPRHQLEQVTDAVQGSTTTYTYDANGNLVQETTIGGPAPGVVTSVYDPQDRLATRTDAAGTTAYAYDAEGRRVSKVTPTQATRFGWDGTRLRRETNVTNNLLAAYDWAGRTLLTEQRLGTRHYAQHDALKTPIRWTRADGADHAIATFDAWGNLRQSSGELPPIRFTGHYSDFESGQYYAEQRYYRSGIGRFNRVDPWSGDTLNPITLNNYLYASGNPLIFIDPDGRISLLSDLASDISAFTDESLAVAKDFGGRIGEASWADKPGLAAGWVLAGGAYIGGNLVNGLRGMANATANATVIAGDALLGGNNRLTSLADEARGEVTAFAEAAAPTIDAFRADWRGSSGKVVAAAGTGLATTFRGVMAGDTQAVLDTASNLNPRRLADNVADTVRRAVSERPVGVPKPIVIGEGVGGGMTTQMVQASAQPPLRPYRGGSHAQMKLPVGDGMESHHMPAKAVSGLGVEQGPAIKMDPIDHRRTSSHGMRRLESAQYRAEIKELIDQGRMRDAMAMEIRDVRRVALEGAGDRTKYNEAMREMLNYAKQKGWLDRSGD